MTDKICPINLLAVLIEKKELFTTALRWDADKCSDEFYDRLAMAINYARAVGCARVIFACEKSQKSQSATLSNMEVMAYSINAHTGFLKFIDNLLKICIPQDDHSLYYVISTTNTAYNPGGGMVQVIDIFHREERINDNSGRQAVHSGFHGKARFE